MKTALVLGAGGFVGGHMVKRLKTDGYWVRGVDIKHCEFSKTAADDLIIADLRSNDFVKSVMRLSEDRRHSFFPAPFENSKPFDEIYQLAADMGGAGYVFSGENDSDIMHNSSMINLNVLSNASTEKIFYSSSACIYPEELQKGYNITNLCESDAYPANPDSDYGWEKLFSEHLYLAYARNHNIDIRIARFHNIFGIEGTYKGGREKAPAAMCRKVVEGIDSIEVWGTGLQTRSFLYIDECIEGVMRLMKSDHKEPINIGSDESISINDLAQMVIDISGKDLIIKNVHSDAIGVNGRNSDNTKIEQVLNWKPSQKLRTGMEKTFKWIENELITK